MDSDTTGTGGGTPEEKPDQGAPAGQAATEVTPAVAENPPAAAPAAVKKPTQHNWMMIALIAVSCAAIFLLVVTLALGAALAFHHERGDRFEQFGRRQMGGPMMRGYGEGGGRQVRPWLQQSAPPAQSAPPSGQ
jgi:hypothetical protein